MTGSATAATPGRCAPTGRGHTEFLGGATAAWSPDGSRLLVNDGHIRVAEVGVDIGAFVDTGVAVPEREQWEAFDFAPDGEHVVFVRKSKCAAAPTALGLGFLAVVPDVLVAETAGANCMVLGILDLGTGTLTDLGHTLVKGQTGGRNLALELPAWSPDGTRIAYTRLDETLDTRELWLVDADGTHPARVAIPADVSVREPRWSPDGTRISFTSQTWLTESTSESVVYVVDLATGHPDRVSIASGPDDRQLCCAAWLDDTHLRVQEATGDGDRAWRISLDAAAHEPELLVDLTDALEAIDPPGRVVHSLGAGRSRSDVPVATGRGARVRKLGDAASHPSARPHPSGRRRDYATTHDWPSSTANRRRVSRRPRASLAVAAAADGTPRPSRTSSAIAPSSWPVASSSASHAPRNPSRSTWSRKPMPLGKTALVRSTSAKIAARRGVTGGLNGMS